MKVKTYGVPDLTEWHGKVKAGTLEVSVSFTGGTASPSGAQPAYFMTKDPIVQFIIENSKEFKNGFIILVMSQDIAGEHPRMAVPKAKKISMNQQEDKPTSEQIDEGDVNEEVSTVSPESAAAQKIEVPSLEDAKAYLVENFGISRTKLRSRKQIEDAAAANGIEFSFE